MQPSNLLSQLITESNPRSPITESYRTVRTNIQFASAVDDIKVIMVTSSLPGEGKTSTASNVAVVSAQVGKRVLLIDADMRKPQVHQRFQVSNLDGLSSVLIKERSLEECIINTKTEGLSVLTSGPIPPNPSEMLSSQSFTQLIELCKQQYDFIIIDSPPVLSVSDPLVLTRVAEGVVLVVNSKGTNRNMAQKSIGMLQQVGARLLGVVLNRVERKRGGQYYYYNYYGAEAKATVQG